MEKISSLQKKGFGLKQIKVKKKNNEKSISFAFSVEKLSCFLCDLVIQIGIKAKARNY